VELKVSKEVKEVKKSKEIREVKESEGALAY
jgi:hypothetical protein